MFDLSANKSYRMNLKLILRYKPVNVLSFHVTGLKMVLEILDLENEKALKPIKKMLDEYEKLMTK